MSWKTEIKRVGMKCSSSFVGDTHSLTHPESGWLFYPFRITRKIKTECDRPFIKQPTFISSSQPSLHPLHTLYMFDLFYISRKCFDITSGCSCDLLRTSSWKSGQQCQFDRTLFAFLASAPDICRISGWPLYSRGKRYYRTIYRGFP